MAQRFLARKHIRQMGMSSCVRGLQDRILRKPSIDSRSSSNKITRESTCSVITGSTGDVAEGCNRVGTGSIGGILLDVLPGTQERWRFKTGSESQIFKQVCENQKIQDALSSIHSPASVTGRLVGRNRSERCIFPRAYASRTQEVPKICLSGPSVSVQGSSIWSFNSPKSIHKSSCTSYGAYACKRRKNIPLSRRLLASCKHPLSVTSHAKDRQRSFSTSRLHNQFEKVKTSTIPSYSILGNGVAYQSRKSILATSEDSVSHDLCPAFHEGRSVQGSSFIPQIIGTNDGFNPYGSICSTVHETHSMVPEQEMEHEFPESSFPSDDYQRIGQSSSLVGLSRQSISRPILASSRGRLGTDDGCLPPSMGRLFGSIQGSGEMEISPKRASHQCFGTASSMELSQSICPSGTGSESFVEDRQSSGSLLYKQNGRNQVSKNVQFDLANDQLVHSKEDRSDRSSYSWRTECPGRQVIQTSVPSNRMGAEQSGCGSSVQQVGDSSDGFVCFPSECKTSSILHSPLPSTSLGKGCSTAVMVQTVPVCLPSISTPQGGIIEGQEGAGVDDSYCPKVDQERMVQSSPRSFSGYSSDSTGLEESGLSGEGDSFACQPSRTLFDGLADQRNVLLAEGFSDKTADTILASKSKNTMAQYKSGWSHFSEWCGRKDIDPYTSTITMILNYFQDCFDQGLQFNTVKSRQSAIAANHAKFPFKCSLASHPAVKKFLKGAAMKYASVRTRVPAWDLPIVLKALKVSPFEPMETIDIKFVTLKTAFLLAIVSARRLGELQAFDVRPQFSSISQESVVLKPNAHFIPKVPTTQSMENVLELAPFGVSNRGHPQGTAKALCLCRALSIYVDRTKDNRKSDQLFVSFKPGCEGKKVSKNTLASWIKKVVHQAYSLQDLEPPVGVKAHGTRAQSVSWADMKGITIMDICRMAGWKKADTFMNHYKLHVSPANSLSARHAHRVLQASEFV